MLVLAFPPIITVRKMGDQEVIEQKVIRVQLKRWNCNVPGCLFLLNELVTLTKQG